MAELVGRRDLLGAAGFAVAAAAALGISSGLTGRKSLVATTRADALETLPPLVGEWHVEKPQGDMVDPVIFDEAFATALQMYDRTVARDYVRGDGARIMLSLAYMRRIEQETKFHWPEFCYSTQGFVVGSKLRTPIRAASPNELIASRFNAQLHDRREIVYYWMRVGDSVPVGSMQLRLTIFEDSFRPLIPDGTLVRASIIVPPQGDQTALDRSPEVEDFLAGLVQAARPETRHLLAGTYA